MTDDRVPTGWKRLDHVSEVWVSPNGTVAVLGSPPRDDEERPEEERHNCDAMGCGQSHVILRGKAWK